MHSEQDLGDSGSGGIGDKAWQIWVAVLSFFPSSEAAATLSSVV